MQPCIKESYIYQSMKCTVQLEKLLLKWYINIKHKQAIFPMTCGAIPSSKFSFKQTCRKSINLLRLRDIL